MISSSRFGIIVALLAAVLMAGGCAGTGDRAAEAAQAKDNQIEIDVAQALLGRPTLQNEDITVSSEGGIVTLTGTVPSSIERTLAARVANAVEGVSSVQNKLSTQ